MERSPSPPSKRRKVDAADESENGLRAVLFRLGAKETVLTNTQEQKDKIKEAVEYWSENVRVQKNA